jgi:CRP-like cAMP-binding protein
MMGKLQRAAELLAKNPVFASLTSSELETLASRSILRRFDARATVLSDGDDPEHVYALTSGSVRVFHASPTGLEVVVKIFKPPSVFGEMEVISRLPFLENVATLEESEVILIPAEVFLAFVRSHQGMTLALLVDVCARLCIASHNEKGLAFHDVRTRLANFLVCYAAFDGEPTASGVRIRLRLTQDDMATALGVTRRAVAKEILRWQRDGVIERSQGRYLIRDQEALSREAAALHLSVTYKIGGELHVVPPAR